jgi:hypothetical protein
MGREVLVAVTRSSLTLGHGALFYAEFEGRRRKKHG